MQHYLIRPKRFLAIAQSIRPWLFLISMILLVSGIWYGLFDSPPDYQHKDTVRIMYVHVPSSWFALSVYVMMAFMHGAGHIWGLALADIGARAIAPAGLLLTVVSLVTGSLWGKPAWGTWWVWDARLTSMFILLLLYIGYLLLVNSSGNALHSLRAGRILTLIGVLNIPVIKWSVNWWNTLHQPASIVGVSSIGIHNTFLAPLFLMSGGLFLFLLWVCLLRAETEILKYKNRSLHHQERWGPHGASSVYAGREKTNV